MTFDLRAERMNRGITIAALSKDLGVSRHTLMRVERGAVPHAPTAAKIASWVGVPASELWPTERQAA